MAEGSVDVFVAQSTKGTPNNEFPVAGVIAHTPVQLVALGPTRFAASVYGREKLDLVSLDGERTFVGPPEPGCTNILDLLAVDFDRNGVDDIYVASPYAEQKNCQPWVALDGGYGEVHWLEHVAHVEGPRVIPSPFMSIVHAEGSEWLVSCGLLGAPGDTVSLMNRTDDDRDSWSSQVIGFPVRSTQIPVDTLMLDRTAIQQVQNAMIVRINQQWIATQMTPRKEASDVERMYLTFE